MILYSLFSVSCFFTFLISGLTSFVFDILKLSVLVSTWASEVFIVLNQVLQDQETEVIKATAGITEIRIVTGERGEVRSEIEKLLKQKRIFGAYWQLRYKDGQTHGR